MREKLGELLIRKGLLTQAQLEQALKAQMIYGGRLGTNLVELEAIDVDVLAKCLGEQTHLPVAMVNDFEAASPQTRALVKADLAERFVAFPLFQEGPKKLRVAMASGFDPAKVDELGFMTGMRIVPYIAPEIRIYFYLERQYGIKRDERYIRVSLDPAPRRKDAGSAPEPVKQVNPLFGAVGGYLSEDSEDPYAAPPGAAPTPPPPAARMTPTQVPVAAAPAGPRLTPMPIPAAPLPAPPQAQRPAPPRLTPTGTPAVAARPPNGEPPRLTPTGTPVEPPRLTPTGTPVVVAPPPPPKPPPPVATAWDTAADAADSWGAAIPGPQPAPAAARPAAPVVPAPAGPPPRTATGPQIPIAPGAVPAPPGRAPAAVPVAVAPPPAARPPPPPAPWPPPPPASQSANGAMPPPQRAPAAPQAPHAPSAQTPAPAASVPSASAAMVPAAAPTPSIPVPPATPAAPAVAIPAPVAPAPPNGANPPAAALAPPPAAPPAPAAPAPAPAPSAPTAAAPVAPAAPSAPTAAPAAPPAPAFAPPPASIQPPVTSPLAPPVGSPVLASATPVETQQSALVVPAPAESPVKPAESAAASAESAPAPSSGSTSSDTSAPKPAPAEVPPPAAPALERAVQASAMSAAPPPAQTGEAVTSAASPGSPLPAEASWFGAAPASAPAVPKADIQASLVEARPASPDGIELGPTTDAPEAIPLASAWEFVRWEGAEVVAPPARDDEDLELARPVHRPPPEPAPPEPTELSLADAEAALQALESAADMARLILAYCRSRFARGLLLGNDGGAARALAAYGPGLTPGQLPDISFLLQEASMFRIAAETGAPVLMSFATSEADHRFFRLLDGAPAQWLVAPIAGNGQLEHFLYLDCGPEFVSPDHRSSVQKLVTRVGELLARSNAGK